MRFPFYAVALLTTSCTIAASASPTCHGSQNILYPNTTSLYDVSTGLTEAGVKQGCIKNIEGDKTVITTLVAFEVPCDWAQRKCKFLFETEASNTPKRVDVFTSLQPTTGSGSKPSGSNNRDDFVGRFVVNDHDIAYWELVSAKGPEFPCPSGEIVGYELVGVYNMGELTWCVETGSGPMIELLH